MSAFGIGSGLSLKSKEPWCKCCMPLLESIGSGQEVYFLVVYITCVCFSHGFGVHLVISCTANPRLLESIISFAVQIKSSFRPDVSAQASGIIMQAGRIWRTNWAHQDVVSLACVLEIQRFAHSGHIQATTFSCQLAPPHRSAISVPFGRQ